MGLSIGPAACGAFAHWAEGLGFDRWPHFLWTGIFCTLGNLPGWEIIFYHWNTTKLAWIYTCIFGCHMKRGGHLVYVVTCNNFRYGCADAVTRLLPIHLFFAHCIMSRFKIFIYTTKSLPIYSRFLVWIRLLVNNVTIAYSVIHRYMLIIVFEGKWYPVQSHIFIVTACTLWLPHNYHLRSC